MSLPMRTLHRLLAIVTVLLMLYLGVTGTLIQLIDLTTLFKHAPETDPVMQSINEGRFGNGDMQVITDADFEAPPLPQDLDYGRAFATVFQAVHRQSPGEQPRFVELRMARGTAIGQARLGKTVLAFDAQTGAKVPAVGVRPLRLPPSFRETLKEWHRFWTRRDVPGVWVELTAGIILWTLIISGLVMYFRLLKARSKKGHTQMFWMSGGTWKALHRVISVVAAVFIIAIAFSGTWLGFESVWHTFASKPGPQPDSSSPMSDSQVQRMASITLADFRRLEPQTPIKVLRVRVYGTMNQGGIVTGGPETRQVLFDTATGSVAGLGEPGYPASGFPFGTQTHENIKHFHSGYLLGLPARLMNLTAGLSLIYLSISGIIMYLDLWRQRRKVGRKQFLWA
jgi:uncharacterized iron-regulated membrane protein